MSDLRKQFIAGPSDILSRQTWRDLKRLVGEMARPHIGSYAVAMVLMSIFAGTTAMSAWLMRDVVNGVFIDKDTAKLFGLSALIVAIYLARGLSYYWQSVIMSSIGNRIVADAQIAMYDKLMSMSVGKVLGKTSTELITVISNATTAARGLLQSLITSIGRDLLSLIGLISVMIIQDPFLSLMSLLVLPLVAWSISNLSVRMRRLSRSQVDINIDLGNSLRQTIQGFKVVKAFGLERHLTERMANTVDSLRGLANKSARINARTIPLVDTLGGLVVAAVVFYGGWQVAYNNYTPGQFFSYIAALLMAYDPARRLANLRVAMEPQLVGLRMMYDFLDQKVEHFDKPEAETLVVSKGDVLLENISFGYQPGQDVIDHMTLHLPAGTTTALVGPSGGGKSTVVNLILRFFAPHSGRILIDGQDIAAAKVDSLRAAIAYVGQDAYLFDGSVRDNILAGRTRCGSCCCDRSGQGRASA